MKVAIYLQRYFSRLGTAIAYELQNSHRITEFCGYTETRHAEAFLKSQTDVRYSSILVDEEIHQRYKNETIDKAYLEWLEKEYGIPNCWPYLLTDRHVMMSWPKYDYGFIPEYSHEDMLRILQVKAKAIIAFLETEKPDVILFSVTGSVASLLLYHIGRKMGIKTLNLEPTHLPSRMLLTETCMGFYTGADALFQELQSGTKENLWEQEALEFLNIFRNRPTKKVWTYDSRQPVLPLRVIKDGLAFLRHAKDYIVNKEWNDYSALSPVSYLRTKLAKKLRHLINLKPLYTSPNLQEDFVFFPLHWEPELELMMRGQPYDNQIELIRHIAKALPVHYKLYVKEHPGMEVFRPKSYYRELLRIPNVQLIDVHFNTFDLITHAKLVTVISSTVGWEALLLQKPVLTFGSAPYHTVSMVHKAPDLRQLPAQVKHILASHVHNEKELVDFISAIIGDSIAFDYMKFWFTMEYQEMKQQPQLKEFCRYLTTRIFQS